ncbi:hypothetical protein MGU_11551 [Metarhizium guizhouense ARSEF 977]|uniref:Secreted protein n=1 Tax=Metarhizium guizhouense (strain ARSEF 977) TaxID=1276136 RepID=A0A0B4GMY3_METGA|nr:hypothetical protein MGU_11551 [Metarhizium guizhouense ARSEF 977]
MQLSLVLALLPCLSLAGPLGARQDAPKKPFKLRGNDYENCGGPWGTELSNKSEACVGTLKYCHEQFFKLHNENFSSEEECLQSRDPAPDPSKKLWQQPGDYYTHCFAILRHGPRPTSEGCVGTLKYCKDKLFQRHDEKFSSAKECLESRNPPPSSVRPAELDALLCSPEASATPCVCANTA